MTENNHTLPSMGAEQTKKTNYLFPIVIVIGVTVALLILMKMLKPEIEKKQDAVTVPLVEVINITAIYYVIPIQTEGMVLPKTSINFAAEITGKIVSVAKQFSHGGKFKQGDVLVEVDPLDYELAITRANANVSARIAALDLEQAKSDLARDDWKKYGKKGKQSALNLNLPQVASAKAALDGAKADLKLAKRNLQKTQIIAPFDGVILTKNVDIGQFVNIGMSLANIASTEIAEIRVALSDAQLSQSGLNQSIQDVLVKVTSEEIQGIQWQGRVAQIEAQRDARTLMNHVIVEIDQPFLQQSVPLRFNTFVSVEFAGIKLNAVYPLARNFMMLNNKVKVLDSQSKLLIKSVEVAYSNDEYYYIAKGLEQGDRVIITQLPNVKSGSLLELDHKKLENMKLDHKKFDNQQEE